MTAARELDDVLVERMVAGSVRVRRNAQSPERNQAVRILAGRGMSDREIGERLGMTLKAVQKLRERRCIPSGVPKPGMSGELAWRAVDRPSRRPAA